MTTTIVTVLVGPRPTAGVVEVGPHPVTVLATAQVGPRGPTGDAAALATHVANLHAPVGSHLLARVYGSSVWVLPLNSWETMDGDVSTVINDASSPEGNAVRDAWNPATGTWTCPADGVYSFIWYPEIQAAATVHLWGLIAEYRVVGPPDDDYSSVAGYGPYMDYTCDPTVSQGPLVTATWWLPEGCDVRPKARIKASSGPATYEAWAFFEVVRLA